MSLRAIPSSHGGGDTVRRHGHPRAATAAAAANRRRKEAGNIRGLSILAAPLHGSVELPPLGGTINGSLPADLFPADPSEAVAQSLLTKLSHLKAQEMETDSQTAQLEALWAAALTAGQGEGGAHPARTATACAVLAFVVGTLPTRLRELMRAVYAELLFALYDDCWLLEAEVEAWTHPWLNGEPSALGGSGSLGASRPRSRGEGGSVAAAGSPGAGRGVGGVGGVQSALRNRISILQSHTLYYDFYRGGLRRPASPEHGQGLASPEGSLVLPASSFHSGSPLLSDDGEGLSGNSLVPKTGDLQTAVNVVYRSMVRDVPRRAFREWRQLTLLSRMRTKATDRYTHEAGLVVQGRAFGTWRLWVHKQRRLKGRDVQQFVEVFKYQVRELKTQLDELDLRKRSLEEELAAYHANPCVVDLTAPLSDSSGATIADGVVEFRQLTDVERREYARKHLAGSKSAARQGPGSPAARSGVLPGRAAPPSGDALDGQSQGGETDSDYCSDDEGPPLGDDGTSTPRGRELSAANVARVRKYNQLMGLKSKQGEGGGVRRRVTEASLDAEVTEDTVPIDIPFYAVQRMSTLEYRRYLQAQGTTLGKKEVLLSWINNKLREVGHPDEVTNYTMDLSDATAYAALARKLVPANLWTLPPSTLESMTDQERAQAVLDVLERMGLVERGEVTVPGITIGAEEGNQLLVAKLFVYDLLTRRRSMRQLHGTHAATIAGGHLAQANQQRTNAEDTGSGGGGGGGGGRTPSDLYSARTNGVEAAHQALPSDHKVPWVSFPDWRVVNVPSTGLRLVVTNDVANQGTQTNFCHEDMGLCEELYPALLRRFALKRNAEDKRAKEILLKLARRLWAEDASKMEHLQAAAKGRRVPSPNAMQPPIPVR